MTILQRPARRNARPQGKEQPHSYGMPLLYAQPQTPWTLSLFSRTERAATRGHFDELVIQLSWAWAAGQGKHTRQLDG
jgi:hypothetical protein